MTVRDQTWNEVLNQIRKTGYFRISDLDLPDPQRHTVRRVLSEMEELGWVARPSKHAATWCAGEKAEQHLNLHPDIIERAQQQRTGDD